MAQFTIYRSSDNNAPSLNGITGSLLNVLDACLVTGYGSMPGAGWIRTFPHTGSIGCFNINTASLNLSSSYLVLNDAGPGTFTGRESRCWGYESVTSILGGKVTGSGIFPTGSQIAAVFFKKSNNADSSSTEWIMFADSRSMYLYNSAGGTAGYYSLMFGDIDSFSSTYTYRSILIGRNAEGSALGGDDRLGVLANNQSTITSHFVARPYTNIGSSTALGKHGNAMLGTATLLVGILPAYNIPDRGIYICPVFIHDASGNIIGKMRGFYHYLHPLTSVVNGKSYIGSGSYAGKTFMFVTPGINANVFLMETSNTI